LYQGVAKQDDLSREVKPKLDLRKNVAEHCHQSKQKDSYFPFRPRLQEKPRESSNYMEEQQKRIIDSQT